MSNDCYIFHYLFALHVQLPSGIAKRPLSLFIPNPSRTSYIDHTMVTSFSPFITATPKDVVFPVLSIAMSILLMVAECSSLL